MAIDPVAFDPSVQFQSQSPGDPDPYDPEHVTDPKLRLQRTLIEAMFGSKDEDEKDGKNAVNVPEDHDGDSVEISNQSIELYHKSQQSLEVSTPDGTLRVRIESETAAKAEVTQQSGQQPQAADPLIIDMDNDGLELTDVRSDKTVTFDINGDGSKETVSWVKPDDGMLVMDRNGNGAIDSGSELFGDQNGATSGIAELAKFDENLDGVIDAVDPVFSRLQVWQDANQDGISGASELRDLNTLGIASLSLNLQVQPEYVARNLVTGYASVQDSDGDTRKMGEAHLNFFA